MPSVQFVFVFLRGLGCNLFFFFEALDVIGWCVFVVAPFSCRELSLTWKQIKLTKRRIDGQQRFGQHAITCMERLGIASCR
jgi:hypothetical protein